MNLQAIQNLFGGGQTPQINDPYQAQMAYDSAMMDRERAQQLMNAQYTGGGGLGIAAVLIQALKGQALDRKAGETASQALKRKFEFDTQAANLAATKKAEEEERKFRRDLERDQKKAEATAKAAAANRAKTAFDYLPEGERAKAARINSGLELGAQAPREAPRVTYGQPIEVMGPDGKAMLVRPGSDGSMQPVSGFAPRPQPGNVPAGYQPTPDGKLTFIPGGPADPNRPIPVAGEQAARLAMSDVFLSKVPTLLKEIGGGKVTGPVDSMMAATGYGRAGEISRQLASGADALLRNLTGAGMSNTEAEKYAARYRESPGDTAKTLTSKVKQLAEELQAYKDKIGGGQPQTAPTSNYQSVMAKYGL